MHACCKKATKISVNFSKGISAKVLYPRNIPAILCIIISALIYTWFQFVVFLSSGTFSTLAMLGILNQCIWASGRWYMASHWSLCLVHVACTYIFNYNETPYQSCPVIENKRSMKLPSTHLCVRLFSDYNTFYTS